MFSGASQAAIVCVFFIFVVFYARIFFRKGLRSLPGPLLAKVSGLYRLSLVYDGHAPERYRDLHRKYGNIVRTGPNHVSISDASMIPTIYGIGSKFLKVNINSLHKNPTNHETDAILHDNVTILRRYENGQSVFDPGSSVSLSLEEASCPTLLNDEHEELRTACR